MTQGQIEILRELSRPQLRMRLSNRERQEVERLAGLGEAAVLSVELAAWVERIYARAKRVSERGRR